MTIIRHIAKNVVAAQTLQAHSVRFWGSSVGVKSTTGASRHDFPTMDRAPGARKAPCPHEDILIVNQGRYPPHLKIDMEHPENWPKHFPPFSESRRPDRWPLFRAVQWTAYVWLAICWWLCPKWMIPVVYPDFPWINKFDNWEYEEPFPDDIGEDPEGGRSLYIIPRAGVPGGNLPERGDKNFKGEDFHREHKGRLW